MLSLCICPLQLNPTGSALVPGRLYAAIAMGDLSRCVNLVNPGLAKFIWLQWPALRALLLPRLRLMYNGLTALIGNPGLDDDNGRQALAVIVLEAGMASNISASVHTCGGEAGRTAALDLQVAELAQLLIVQPQFLNMVEAGAAWARQRSQLGFSRINPVPVSVCLEDITKHGMDTLHNCLCLSSPFSPIDPASPALLRAAFSWFTTALQMIKAGGWSTEGFESLLRSGLAIPLVIMIRRAEAESERIPQPILPWADRPRCLECALQAAEWMLSAASKGEQCDDGYIWNICYVLVNELHESGVDVDKAWCGAGDHVAHNAAIISLTIN